MEHSDHIPQATSKLSVCAKIDLLSEEGTKETHRAYSPGICSGWEARMWRVSRGKELLLHIYIAVCKAQHQDFEFFGLRREGEQHSENIIHTLKNPR